MQQVTMKMKATMIKTVQVVLYKGGFIWWENMRHRPGRNYGLAFKSLVPEQGG